MHWRTPPRDFAALVTESTPARFAARVFHFGPAERKFDAELPQLKPGGYQFTLTEAKSGRPLQSGAVSEKSGRRTLALTLPSGVEAVLQVTAK